MKRGIGYLLAVFSVALAFMAAPAHAATLTVTANAPDVLNGADASCALREAIKNMNDGAATYADCANTGAAYGTGDAINLPAGTYTTAINGGSENNNATGDYDISKSVSITGAGADSTIIDGGALDRVFHITVAASVVSFSGVTIRNGNETGDGYGGGIYNNNSTLNITDSTISGNTTLKTRTYGGGIYSTGAGNTVTITGSTISGTRRKQQEGWVKRRTAAVYITKGVR